MIVPLKTRKCVVYKDKRDNDCPQSGKEENIQKGFLLYLFNTHTKQKLTFKKSL
jgi:hypothetical protein